MNKKPFVIIGFAVLVILAAPRLSAPKSYAEPQLPYAEPATCQQSWMNEMAIMEDAWVSHLDTTLNQEEPTSELVDDAFEGMRTFQCWIQNLCQIVRLSASVPEEAIQAAIDQRDNWLDGLLYQNAIPDLPGCMPIDEIEIPGTRLQFMPLCQANPHSNIPPNTQGVRNFQKCMDVYNISFNFAAGASKAASPDDVVGGSVALIALEQRLKTNAHDKKTGILGAKLNSIIQKMPALERTANSVADLINKLDSRLNCYPLKCD